MPEISDWKLSNIHSLARSCADPLRQRAVCGDRWCGRPALFLWRRGPRLLPPAASQKLVTSIAARTKKLGIAGDWEARATALVNTQVYPALERQIATFAKAAAKATDVAGVHRLPDSAAYYEWALKLGTTTTHSAADIHAIGLEQNKLLQSRIDAILKAQGITHGTVGARLLALSKDPSRFDPDPAQGREQLIAY